MKAIPIYFENGRYWSQSDSGSWIAQGQSGIGRVLKVRHKLNPKRFAREKDHCANEIEAALYDIETGNAVDYAGPLAGYQAGVKSVHGQRILVTESPQLIAPRKGKWLTLKTMLTEQFGEQLPYFLAWLQQSRRCLEKGEFAPAPAIALAGSAGSGKSLLQSVITEALGGRSARAYRYMAGKTDFNLDLFRAEHLMIEDDMPLKDMVSRRQLGAHIKSFLFNEIQSLHAKGRDAVSLSVFWRLSISLNDEPENLMVLPPLDDSLMDKLMLFRVAPSRVFPRPDRRRAFRDKITSELPAFLSYLRSWRLPASVRSDGRSGIPLWHHPELVKGLEGLAPETKLWELIHDAEPWGEGPWWTGSATELERLIAGKYYREAGSVFTHANSCGTYLARLQRSNPGRLTTKTVNGKKRWTITAPSE